MKEERCGGKVGEMYSSGRREKERQKKKKKGCGDRGGVKGMWLRAKGRKRKVYRREVGGREAKKENGKEDKVRLKGMREHQ